MPAEGLDGVSLAALLKGGSRSGRPRRSTGTIRTTATRAAGPAARSATATGSSSSSTRPAGASCSTWSATPASRPTWPTIRADEVEATGRRSWRRGGWPSAPRCPRPTPPTRPIPRPKDGSITLPAATAEVHGVMLRYEPLPHKNTLGYWVRAGRLGVVGVRRQEARRVRRRGARRLRDRQRREHRRVPVRRPGLEAHRAR